ncbi:MAG: TIR domain-containing protein [Oscillibacter sp.]|nr:TIR domain-containing protein [Oscillibacter sp.]
MEAYEGREPYIFISYARVDADKVTPYLEALSNAGYRFWYDAGIKAGEYWTKTLAEEINGCVVFCPLYSKAFNASRFCFDETNYAYRKNKAIVPIYLEKIAQESLDEFYQFLGGRQDLRLYEYANAAEFVERLGREQAFASCKAPEWNDFGQIQWRFSEADGVLTIAKNEEWWFKYASMPDYQNNLRKAGSTAPWMMYREKILSVKIGEDVHTIGDYAFRDCRSLTDVHILGNVFKIGNEAFWDCHCLTEVRIPDGVKVIGSNALGFVPV